MNYDETNIEQEFEQYAKLAKEFENLAMQAEVTGAIRSVSAILTFSSCLKAGDSNFIHSTYQPSSRSTDRG